MRFVGFVALLVSAVALGRTENALSISSTPFSTRSCGTLSVGIGWHVAASPNVTCLSARRLMVAYFKERDHHARVVVYRYVCTARDLPDGEHIRCTRAGELVTARSFGY
jgi:hypothetical protein